LIYYKIVKNKLLLPGLITGIIIIGLFFRLYHIEFGLPHSFYADEPEIVELAIKYTYEFRDIFGNNNLYKLIPVNYVYGSLPSYILTFTTMGFSKFSNLIGYGFDKMSLYVFARLINTLISMLIPITGAYLYHKLFKDKLGTLITLVLLSLNWKLIVHAHYVNADIIQTALILVSFLFIYLYDQDKNDTVTTNLSALFFGLALGTKITTLLTFPLYLIFFVKKKHIRNLVAFCFIVFGVYIATNPFSFVFAEDFLYRMVQMRQKEAGLVFDSSDSSPFKYISALSFIVTLPVLLFSLYGIFLNFKDGIKKVSLFNWFLIGNVLVYFIFFSLQSRRVDRWMLPVLPILIIYAGWGLSNLRAHLSKISLYSIYLLTGLFYLTFSILLIFQFQRHTPKSQAYLWMQENAPELTWKLVYTEEGLDPMNKLKFADVHKYNVYSSENAQFFLPENPLLYDYVILSSRPMQNYKKPIVKNTYPFYYEKWSDFENAVLNESNFELVKEFSLIKPNLIPLSDVYIYKNINPANRPPPLPIE
jgi:hypothetical protein